MPTRSAQRIDKDSSPGKFCILNTNSQYLSERKKKHCKRERERERQGCPKSECSVNI